MTESALQFILGALGTGFLGTIVAAIVRLIRGRAGDKRTDKKLRADITDQVTDMASEWLDKAERRLKAVEDENAALRREVNALKLAATTSSAQRQEMVTHVAAVHDWIEGGAKPPPPTRPPWAMQTPTTL